MRTLRLGRRLGVVAPRAGFFNRLAVLTNRVGSVLFSGPATNSAACFYRLHLVP